MKTPCIGVAGALAALLCWPTPISSSAQTASEVCGPPAQRTAEEHRRALDSLPQDQWAAGDQSSSLQLPDGRVLWLYGDTIALTDDAAGSRMVHNSMILQSTSSMTVVGGAAEEVIPDAGSDLFWPMQAIVDTGKLRVTAARVRRTGGGEWGFAVLGVDLATFSLPWCGVPRLERVDRTPASDNGGLGVSYGASLVKRGSWIYVYGTQPDPEPDRTWIFGKHVYLARVPVGHLAAPSAWRYWTGSGWSSSERAARKIVDAALPAGGWSTSFSTYVSADGKFNVVTKLDDFLGDEVVLARATGPAGPWTIALLFSSPSYEEPDPLRFTYQPMVHPWAKLSSDQILVTVCRNGGDVFADPATNYRPTYHEVVAPR